ncbi:MAG: pyridine nucleotide-disulfide oxidoreductase [Hyphomicrobiales bacterium]|nr:MAG: pyridine nucleotide-disulfide oxidoreductase [Hyphomicrobiales bacterium]
MVGVVIVGAGQAGFQCADSLRQEGYEGPITLIGEESHPPYQRPPLSKAYLLGDSDAERLKFRADDFYGQNGIDLKLSTGVAAFDRAAKTVALGDGSGLAYDHLVLATGARVRQIPVPGADLDGVFYLKTLADIDRIERRLADAEHVAVVGAGFIGLEFAAVASKLGKKATVFEAMDRVLARVAPPMLSEFYAGVHQAHGVDIRCGAGVAEFAGKDGRIEAVVLADGGEVRCDLVVVGIGVIPNVELAEAAGIHCDNGIVVDDHGRTSDPAVYSAGDCAAYEHPFADARIRLESVQNAADQARSVAAAIVGKQKPYDAVPWFWSDQFDLKLQMAGLSQGSDQQVLRGDMESQRFSIFHFRDGTFRAIDAVNKGADYIMARKLLAAGAGPTPDQAADPDFPLKSLL